jgi:AraC-like DNA-binding protein
MRSRHNYGGRATQPSPALGSYVVERSDTQSAPRDPAGYWTEHVSANHGSFHFQFADPRAFRAKTIVQRSADHRVVDFWSDGLQYSKTQADVRADGYLGNIFFIARDGVLELEQADERIRLQPGHGALISKSRPLQLHHTSCARGLTFDVADARVPDALREGPIPVNLQNGLGSVVAAMISTVSTQHAILDSYEFQRVCATIDDLLFACMVDRGGLPDTLGSVEQAVRKHVARHACDPDLSPASLARSQGWSLRQIQLALQQSGTSASELIRSTRITHAFDLLCQSPPNTTISSIAFASGFRSVTYFNAIFKRHFGMSPREVRALHRVGDGRRAAQMT